MPTDMYAQEALCVGLPQTAAAEPLLYLEDYNSHSKYTLEQAWMVVDYIKSLQCRLQAH